MDGYASMILSFFFGMPMDKEKFDEMFDEGFTKFFRDNPSGYNEVMKEVEQVPENIREGIRERLNKLYEQAKKGGQDGRFEIKITFEDNLCCCEMTRSGKTVHFEELNDKEQVKVCNALAQFYMLFYKAMKGGQDDNIG